MKIRTKNRDKIRPKNISPYLGLIRTGRSNPNQDKSFQIIEHLGIKFLIEMVYVRANKTSEIKNKWILSSSLFRSMCKQEQK